MNLNKSLISTDVLFEHVQLKYFLYIQLLADVENYPDYFDPGLYYVWDVDAFVDTYRRFRVDRVRNALKELEEEKLIVIVHDKEEKTDYIKVGVCVNKKCSVFKGETFDGATQAIKTVEDAFEVYQESAGTYEAARARGFAKRFEELISAIKPEFFTSKDFATCWSLVYAAFYQEQYRNLSGVDYGIFKNLLNLYDATTLFNMMVHFMKNSDKYCKKVIPTPILFSAQKDLVYSDLKGKPKITTVSSRHKREDDRFM